MICYRDRSWCSFSHVCANEKCHRHFGESELAAARSWWGGDDPPVCFMDLRSPREGYDGCGEFIPLPSVPVIRAEAKPVEGA